MRILRSAGACIALLFLIGTLHPVGAQDGELLRWKVKKGQTFHMEMVQEMKQEIDLSGQKQVMPIKFTMNMTMAVNDSNADQFKVTQTIDRIRIKMESPFVNLDYDSDSGKEPEGAAASIAGSFKDLIGLKINQTMTTRGESVDCQIDESALKAIAGSPIGAQFASKESLENLFRSGGCILPEQPVKTGSKWEDKFEIGASGTNVKTTANYTFAGDQDVDGKNLAKIDVTSKIDMVPEDNAPVEIEVTGQENTGEIFFDNEAGIISHSVMKQNMNMNVVSAGMEMKMVMTGTATFTVTPAK